jgi:hypothetical protein
MEVIGINTNNCYIKISYAFPEVRYFKIDVWTYDPIHLTKIEEEGISIISTRTCASVFIDKDREGDKVKVYLRRGVGVQDV